VSRTYKLILTTALQDMYRHYTHFIDEENDIKKIKAPVPKLSDPTVPPVPTHLCVALLSPRCSQGTHIIRLLVYPNPCRLVR
jgi:hypothetical protein